MTSKKIYMVPETAFEQFLKPTGMLLAGSPSDVGGGGTDPTHNTGDHAPGRKPF